MFFLRFLHLHSVILIPRFVVLRFYYPGCWCREICSESFLQCAAGPGASCRWPLLSQPIEKIKDLQRPAVTLILHPLPTGSSKKTKISRKQLRRDLLSMSVFWLLEVWLVVTIAKHLIMPVNSPMFLVPFSISSVNT